MTMLSVIQAASRELALSVPNGVASSTDDGVQQLFGLLNSLGDELTTNYNHDWQALITNATITTVASQTAYDLPSSYGHQINRTHWDDTNNWRLVGPITPQGWQWLQSSSLASTGPRYRFRIQNDQFNIHPTPTTVLSFTFQYVSNAWAIDGDDSSAKTAFTKDTDTSIFRDRLLISGLKLKFYEQKGFDTTILARDFRNNLEAAISQDAGAPTLNMGDGNPVGSLLNWYNIPDSGFGT